MIVLHDKDVNIAAEMLKNSKIVAVPTETVYGLAANALDKNAVSKIFKAKGRPQDNPLIVHIANKSDMFPLISNFPNKANKLIDKFWPGPLTIILPKSDIIPSEVSAGLDTIAIRIPDNQITRELISLARVPLAAPSANRSGRPSPTRLEHVINDMEGRIDAVIDGGNCSIGIESTVISFVGDTPVLLRPGAITIGDIVSTIGDISVNDSVYNKIRGSEKPLSPGMKYKHYSPNAEVVIVNDFKDRYIDFVNLHVGEGDVYALCYEEDLKFIKINALSYGSIHLPDEQARKIFDSLRELDLLGAKIVYARPPLKDGIGLAVYNRLIRAAGFNIINL